MEHVDAMLRLINVVFWAMVLVAGVGAVVALWYSVWRPRSWLTARQERATLDEFGEP